MAGGKSGGRPQKVSPEEVLEKLRSVDEPVGTAAELADELDVSSQTVVRRLETLEERGVVNRKQVGANAVVWWVVANGKAD